MSATGRDTPSEFDPYSQKGMWIPIVAESRDDRVTLFPKLNLLVTGIMVIAWMTLVLGVVVGGTAMAGANVPGWLIPIAVVCSAVPCVLLLVGFYSELSKGPYVVIHLRSRVLAFPRMNKELAYSEVRSVTIGWRIEGGIDGGTLYHFLDAEVFDLNQQLRRVTLVATMNRWELRRLERTVRLALKCEQ